MAKIHKLERHRSRPVRRTSYLLLLYTTGSTVRSTRALRNLMEVCERQLKGKYRLEVIDIYQEPGRATDAQIIAAPTLIKQTPLPVRRLVGDLSNRKTVMHALGVEPGRAV